MRSTPRGARRGSPSVRLRVGFVVIAMVLSIFGARLVQLQGVDPNSYAAMAAAEGMVRIQLPAERGSILDRNGKPLADSVNGMMVVADPTLTAARAPGLARFLYRKLHVDYVSTLEKLRAPDSQFEYIARRVPASKALDVVAAAEKRGFVGLDTRDDPLRDYPAGNVAANVVGFMGTDGPLGGFERTFNHTLAGKNGWESYEVGAGNRLPLGRSTMVKPVNGQDLHTTIDLDLQWYTQRVLQQAVQNAGADSGFAVVMDSRTGEILALADDPTFDPNDPTASPQSDLGSRAMQDAYEPGSVEKILTISSLLNAGLVTPRTKIKVPGELDGLGAPIHDWWPHGMIHLTLTGVIAKSSNIGTVLASDRFRGDQLDGYLRKFGLGRRTNIGVAGESPGILPPTSQWTPANKARMAFGQSLSVNGVQMAAAINTIANGGVRISPSIIEGRATTDSGREVGTDTATRTRVVSRKVAGEMARMMERVVAPNVGIAPAAAVPGYLVAGKTGTAQRVGEKCGCYNGTFTVSFAGFAPADKPRFTVYVVVQNPSNGGGGGSVAGPVFSQIMSYALRRYGVPPTNGKPSHLPVSW